MQESNIQDDTCLHNEEHVTGQDLSLGVNLLGQHTFCYMETLVCNQCKKKRRRKITKEEYENKF